MLEVKREWNLQKREKEYYSKQGKLRVVHGQDKVEDTTRMVLEALEDLS